MTREENSAELIEDEIAQRFGLAQVIYRPGDPGGLEDGLSKVEALSGVDEGLSAVCDALELQRSGLGRCWRAREKLGRDAPVVKVCVWAGCRFLEEGNYAPACGTINLFGTLSSLFHEVAHAIDFQHGNNGVPWSHGEIWIRALNGTPEFCGQLLDLVQNRSRVRLSDMYLAAPHELFARAFECLLVERSGKSWRFQPDCSCSKSYPQGIERDKLSDIIDSDLVNSLRQ